MRLLPAALLLLIAALPAVPAVAADPPSATPVDAREAIAEPESVPVRFRGETLFEVRAPLGGLAVAERAAAIESRISLAAAGPAGALSEIRSIPGASAHDVYVGEQFIVSVTDADANPLGRTREQYAADVSATLRSVLAVEFEGRSLASLLRATAVAIAGTVVFVLLAGFVWRRMQNSEQRWREREASTLRTISLRGLDLLTAEHKIEIVTVVLRVGRILVTLFLTLVWAGATLALFPWTRGFSAEIRRETLGAFREAVGGVLGYLPNLLSIAVIGFVTYLLLRFARFFFERVRREQIRIPNFYPEWADPTYKIVRFVGIALAIVVMYPYLPASQSVAFQGVSVLVGVLVSIGSASAIANMIGGLVITYMRAFEAGDRVRIGDTEGDVISRDAFVVRVRTVKNVEITVPNAMVLSSHVINFSKAARDAGLILHTTVTIGYDVPWRKVHELLLAAAAETEGLEAKPAPFVLQKSLDDFYVSYELNAHTRDPSQMAMIYSRLHAAIQDRFNEAGVEIMSPHYRAQRDGNQVTVPEQYLPGNYVRPRFGLDLLGVMPKPAGSGPKEGGG